MTRIFENVIDKINDARYLMKNKAIERKERENNEVITLFDKAWNEIKERSKHGLFDAWYEKIDKPVEVRNEKTSVTFPSAAEIDANKNVEWGLDHDGFQRAEIDTIYGKTIVTFQSIVFRYIDIHFVVLNVKINLKIHYGCYEGRTGFIHVEQYQNLDIKEIREMLREVIRNGFVQQVVENLKYIDSMISFVKRETNTGKWQRAREGHISFHHDTDEEMGIYLADSPLVVGLNKIIESKKQVE